MLDALTQNNTINWFKIKKKNNDGKSFHLMASFNHWFPINMKVVDASQ
jgi:hypothetical protein